MKRWLNWKNAKALVACCAWGLIVAGNRSAQALPITYTFSGVGSGYVGQASFPDSPFTIQIDADTDAKYRYGSGIYNIPATSSRITISGIGTGVFTSGKSVFVNQNVHAVGFSEFYGGRIASDILDVTHPSFATYDLVSAVSPVATTFFFQWRVFWANGTGSDFFH